ncbi:MAG: hypothetical protein ACP5OG_04265 [Candidatus Nanoarchaeia archaeon]
MKKSSSKNSGYINKTRIDPYVKYECEQQISDPEDKECIMNMVYGMARRIWNPQKGLEKISYE